MPKNSQAEVSKLDEIARLCRPDIYAMKPYSSARTEGSQDASIFLDANENPYPPFPATEDTHGFNRYPEPQPQHLIARFAELYQVDQEEIFLSRGADEAIDLLLRAFCEAKVDGILVTPPTFVMYETAAEIQGAFVTRVPLTEDFQLDVEEMLVAITPETKLVFVCSPNNPTSNSMRRNDIIRLADALFGRALVVVDHLYVDYSDERPLSDDIPAHPNIVVLRSVSKEYSLAGERVGITVAHPEVIRILNRIMAPYPLPVSAIRSVSEAISTEGIEYGRENIRRILADRARVEMELWEMESVDRIFPSDANFLLIQTTDPKLLTQMMEAEGIKVRDRSSEVPNAVRISIGTSDENARMLEVFAFYNQKVCEPTPQ